MVFASRLKTYVPVRVTGAPINLEQFARKNARLLDLVLGKNLAETSLASDLVRNVYDLGVASRCEPDSFAKLIQFVIEEGARRALEGLLERIEATSHRIILGRPLLSPTYPDIAHDPWRFVATRMRELGI